MANFDDVFHKKIASSQSQNEVILFTRKSRTQLNTGSSQVAELDDDLEVEALQDNSIEYASQKEPNMKIGFNFNNKIELVPVENDPTFIPKQKEIFEIDTTSEVVLVEETSTVKDKPEITSKNGFDIINVTPEDLAIQTQLMNQIEAQNEFKKIFQLKTGVETKEKIKEAISLDENVIQSQLLNEIRNRASVQTDEVSIIETIDDDSESDDGNINFFFIINF